MNKTPLRVRVALFIFAFVTLFSVLFQSRDNVAWALNRVTWYAQMNPISTWFNLWERDQRLGEGTAWWNFFGSSSSFAGAFDNLSVVPVTGLYVAVGPTNASYLGTLYQLVSDDTSAWGGYPQGVGSSALPADSTQVVGQGTLSANTANIGPLTAGSSSGQSVIDLIECKLTPSTDQTSSTINLITSSGSSGGTASVNRDRIDVFSCQFKASASSSSPTVPTVDSGYVAIGYATVPYNTVTITSGMITAEPTFGGFIAVGNFAPTQTTQVGAIGVGTAPHFTGFDGSANLDVGVPGTNTIGLEFGNSISGAGSSGIGSDAGTLNGVTCAAFDFYRNTSIHLACLDGSGDLTAAGNVSAGGNVTASGNISGNLTSSGFSNNVGVCTNGSGIETTTCGSGTGLGTEISGTFTVSGTCSSGTACASSSITGLPSVGSYSMCAGGPYTAGSGAGNYADALTFYHTSSGWGITLINETGSSISSGTGITYAAWCF